MNIYLSVSLFHLALFVCMHNRNSTLFSINLFDNYHLVNLPLLCCSQCNSDPSFSCSWHYSKLLLCSSILMWNSVTPLCGNVEMHSFGTIFQSHIKYRYRCIVTLLVIILFLNKMLFCVCALFLYAFVVFVVLLQSIHIFIKGIWKEIKSKQNWTEENQQQQQ